MKLLQKELTKAIGNYARTVRHMTSLRYAAIQEYNEKNGAKA